MNAVAKIKSDTVSDSQDADLLKVAVAEQRVA